MRGPRGGMIMVLKDANTKKIDKAIFPGLSGPVMMSIAAKAVAFRGCTADFAQYQKQVLENAKTMAGFYEAWFQGGIGKNSRIYLSSN